MGETTRTRAGILMALLAALGLSACGGGSGGDGGSNDGTPPPPPPTSISFDDLTTGFNTLFATAASSSPLALPSSGTASFEGAAVYGDESRAIADIRANPSLASQVELNLDFAQSGVTGRFFDFRSADPNAAVSGELNVVNGSFLATDVYGGRLVGSVTENGSTRTFGGTGSNFAAQLFNSGVTAGVLSLDEGSNSTIDLKGNFAADNKP